MWRLFVAGIGLLFFSQLSQAKHPDLTTPESILRYAQSGELSKIWWSLTDAQRWNISTVLIDTFQNKVGFIQQFYTKAGTIQQGWCVNNATVRYETFNGANFIDEGYFYGNDVPIKVTSSYHLPVYLTDLDNPWHTIVAIQIKQDKSKLDSWRFFQYTENNIRPSESWQMQIPLTIKIRNAEIIRLNSFSSNKPSIVEFKIT